MTHDIDDGIGERLHCLRCGAQMTESQTHCDECDARYLPGGACFRCGFRSTLKRWHCPRCRGLMLVHRPVLFFSGATVFLGSLCCFTAIAMGWSSARTYGMFIFCGALLAYFGVSQFKNFMWLRALRRTSIARWSPPPDAGSPRKSEQ